MNKSTRVLLVSLLSVAVLAGCSKKVKEQPAAPVEPTPAEPAPAAAAPAPATPPAAPAARAPRDDLYPNPFRD